VDGRIVPAPVVTTAHANRVPVEHGHTVVMSCGFERAPSVDDARAVLAAWRGDARVRGLPSAPERPVILDDAPAAPQPRRQVHAGRGMSITVGRLRTDPIWHLRLVAMGHNVIRGAAGGSILNAELLATLGAFDPR
jgi:aspartate-semialdehyde dehydrogenase